jgi:peptidoglycan/xylan/chitin deacetylase (PgdA/CDA1 family)
MDIDRYDWSNRFEGSHAPWPGGAGVALWIVVSLEWFRFDHQDAAVRAFGGPSLEAPDFFHYSHRDYGNRVGAFRLMEHLSRHQIRVTAAVNSSICDRYPALVERAIEHGWELIGHGTTSTDVLHEDMNADVERALVRESLTKLRDFSGQPVAGWLSPGMSESSRTLELLAGAGVEYVCDWVNDDLPYELRTSAGPLVALPYSYEINDVHVMWELTQTAAAFADQVLDQARALVSETASHGARVMCIALHPWLIGAPHRIKYLDQALDELATTAGIWSATGTEILAAYRQGAGREKQDREPGAS